MIYTLYFPTLGTKLTLLLISLISSTPLFDAASISIISTDCLLFICVQFTHLLQGFVFSKFSQLIVLAKDTTILSLTATPPYDSEYSEWKKYISLCGEIDAEITVPELVKANNLCPHQDYIYFSYPTQEEQLEINKYKKNH